MAAHAARRLLPMAENLRRIVGIELLVAAQGVEMRTPLKTSVALTHAIGCLRESVQALGDDRFMAWDLKAAADLIWSGAIQDAAGPELLPTL